MKKTTCELEELLKEVPQERLDCVIHEIDSTNFVDYFSLLLNKYQVSTADLIKKTMLARTYAYQIINGTKKKASRNKILQLILSLGCTLDECNRLLTLSHHERLYSKDKRDALIIYCVTHQYSVFDTNDSLQSRNFDILE